MVFRFQSRLPYILFVAAILVLDRWTKSLILNDFDLHETVGVIDGFFNITYVRNTGVAFGIFSSISSPLKALFLSLFTGAAVIVVIIYSLRSPVTNRLLQFALACIMGGALGNLYDRIAYGYVIDFLEIHAGSYYWPAFNIADSAISIGVVMLGLEIFRDETRSRSR